MKYIITEEGEVIMFSTNLNHASVAAQLGVVPVSAGFVKVYGQVIASGESESLNLKSRVEDIERIEAQLSF